MARLVGTEDIGVECDVGALLLHGGECGRVLRAGEADGHAARLVVASDDDEGVLGMLLHEIHGHADGGVEGDDVAYGRGGVIGVAGPVDLAGLHGEEESLRALGREEFYPLGYVIRERRVARLPVDVVGHGHGILEGLVDRDDLPVPGLECPEALRGGHDLVAFGLHVLDRVGLVALGALRLAEAAAAEEIEARVGELERYVVHVPAARDLRVEPRRRRVVERYVGYDAHPVSGLLSHFRYRRELGGLSGIHVDDARECLVARGEGGDGARGVRDDRARIVSRGEALGRELGETEPLESRLAGLGLGLGVDLRGAHLGEGHPVADEEEYVLGLSADRGGG